MSAEEYALQEAFFSTLIVETVADYYKTTTDQVAVWQYSPLPQGTTSVEYAVFNGQPAITDLAYQQLSILCSDVVKGAVKGSFPVLRASFAVCRPGDSGDTKSYDPRFLKAFSNALQQSLGLGSSHKALVKYTAPSQVAHCQEITDIVYVDFVRTIKVPVLSPNEVTKGLLDNGLADYDVPVPHRPAGGSVSSSILTLPCGNHPTRACLPPLDVAVLVGYPSNWVMLQIGFSAATVDLAELGLRLSYCVCLAMTCNMQLVVSDFAKGELVGKMAALYNVTFYKQLQVFAPLKTNAIAKCMRDPAGGGAPTVSAVQQLSSQYLPKETLPLSAHTVLPCMQLERSVGLQVAMKHAAAATLNIQPGQFRLQNVTTLADGTCVAQLPYLKMLV